jgi:hypothetical protein
MRKLILLFCIMSAITAAGRSRPFTKTYVVNGILREMTFTTTSDKKFLFTADTHKVVLHNITFDKDSAQIKLAIKTVLPGIEDGTVNEIYGDIKTFYLSTGEWKLTGNGLSNFTGSVKNSFTNSATAGFGLSYFENGGVSFLILGTVTDSRDTVKSQDKHDFGASVLVPGLRKMSLLTNVRTAPKERSLGSLELGRYGYAAFFNASPMFWTTYTAKKQGSSDFDSLPLTKAVIPLTLEGYIYFPIKPSAEILNNPLRASFDIGAVYKYVGGDQLNSEERDFFLGSQKINRIGAFMGVNVRISDFQAYFYGTMIPAGKNESIEGLTGFQLFGGIRVSATLLESGK